MVRLGLGSIFKGLGRSLLCNKIRVFYFICFHSLFISGCWNKTTSDNQQILYVYTYSSFMGIYGPGPKLKENFEKICDCTVEFVNAGDSALLLQKIKILEKTKIDFVIGFDQLSLKEAEGEISWQPLLLDHPNWAPEIPKVESEFFAPYDWSPLTFIYRKQEVSPQSSFFDFLKKSELTKGISLQDPRLSTPGQQFLLWAEYLKRGSAEEFWSLMRPLVHSYSSSWSNSYGLFQRKKAKVTFSYLTSPIYHWKVDQDRNYQPLVFSEGHPYQVEYFAIPKKCTACNLAQRFGRFLLEPNSQKIIAESNFMLPVVNDVVLADDFSKLPKVKLIPLHQVEAFVESKNKIVEHWKKLNRVK